MNCLIIKMGGSGRRFGRAIPKQFTDIKESLIFPIYLKIFKKLMR